MCGTCEVRICDNSGCAWCSERNDALRALSLWFGFDASRAQSADDEGRPLQERIVVEAMREPALGILPTGTGKSVCYQIPALSKSEKTGALTVVLSLTGLPLCQPLHQGKVRG